MVPTIYRGIELQAANENKQPHDERHQQARVPADGDPVRTRAASTWLAIQSGMVRDVTCALVFRVGELAGDTTLLACWPEQGSVPWAFDKKLRFTADQGSPQLEQVPARGELPARTRVYHPIPFTGDNAGHYVVVLEMVERAPAERRTVTNLLHWNCEWLKVLLEQPQVAATDGHSALLPVLSACLDQETFQNTAMTLVTELAARYGCQRVSFGLRKRNSIEVQVLSHSSSFKHQARLVQAIGAAMDEAVDQDQVITYSRDNIPEITITLAHQELASQYPQACVCTLPVAECGEVVGALTLERDTNTPLPAQDIAQVEQLLALMAPVLLLKYRDQQGLAQKAWRSARETVARLFGPAHIRLKLATLVSVVLLLVLTLVQGDWRVTAEAVVEGSVQRTVAAPLDGYIASAEIRAGDVVQAGQLLGTLDDNDLVLERLKWSTLRQQMASEAREAMAQHDRAQVNILNAKVDQAEAELQLIDEQLTRTRLIAPFDGIVIEGDLSQNLGTPVARGDTLFRVAPLDDYRIVLRVDERDIAPVRPGQRGRLVLASMPDEVLELRVDKITSVSSPGQGRNYFRVEASLASPAAGLRPGMEGVGKIEVGEASLFWIWTHELFNWLRLQVWTWWR